MKNSLSALAIALFTLGVSGDKASAVLFAPGIISTKHFEFGGSFSPDGKNFYFTLSSPNYYLGEYTILHTERNNRNWSLPEVVPFSGLYSDRDPFISPDGRKIFFASKRPVNGKSKRDFDLWVVEKSNGTWSEPRHLGQTLNTERNELGPSIAGNGNLYFASSREDTHGLSDLYMSEWINNEFQKPVNLGNLINSSQVDSSPSISTDETTLIFSSMAREDGFGDYDLYISRKNNGVWSKAINLGNRINTEAMEFAPYIKEEKNKKTLYFSSTKSYFKGRLSWTELSNKPQNGFSDIYEILLQLPQLRK